MGEDSWTSWANRQDWTPNDSPWDDHKEMLLRDNPFFDLTYTLNRKTDGPAVKKSDGNHSLASKRLRGEQEGRKEKERNRETKKGKEKKKERGKVENGKKKEATGWDAVKSGSVG